MAKNPELIESVETRWQDIISQSPMVQNPSQLMKDGWGQTYEVRTSGDFIEVRSRKFEEYKKSHPTLFKE